MAGIRLTQFKGIAPRVAPRLLAPENSQAAANVNLASGELLPIRRPAVKFEPSSSYEIESTYYADGVWLTWDKDVDVTRSPLPGTARFIYTGDGEPRITDYTLAIGSSLGDYPEGSRPLGLVAPKTAVTVTPAGTGTSGETVTRYYVYTFYDELNQESAPSPVSTAAISQTDDDWDLSGMDTQPANSGTVTASYALLGNITTFTMAASALHWLRPGDQITLPSSGDTVTVYTTPTTTTFTVLDDYSTETTWNRVAEWGVVTKRIYRTTGTTAEFRLVVDNIPAATTTFTDDIADIDILGDDLVSSSWELPPVNLKGVITLPSGALAGFSGNEICFSEPFQPHAWPSEYRLRSPWAIVSLQYYSSGLVAGTNGNPFQIIGLDPGQMAAQPVNGVYPCVAKRSTVSMVSEVGFATTEGFVTIGDGGVNVISKDWFTRTEWNEHNPSAMEAAYVRGRLYIACQHVDNSSEMLIFDFQDGTGLSLAYINATCLYADPTDGILYFGDKVDKAIYEFDPLDGAYFTMDWFSRTIVTPKPINLGAVKIQFTNQLTDAEIAVLQAAYDAAVAANAAIIAAGPVKGALGSSVINYGYVNGSIINPVFDPALAAPGVTFRLYTNDDSVNPIFTKRIIDERPFRIPSGYKTDRFAVRITGSTRVRSVEVAETVSSLGMA